MGKRKLKRESMTDNPRKGTMDGYRCEAVRRGGLSTATSARCGTEGPLPHDAPGINSMSDLHRRRRAPPSVALS